MFYRASTESRARQLKLTGWVRNLADGRVEVLACGEEENLKELEQWLWQGPAHARVTQVIMHATGFQTFSDFSMRG